MRRLTFLLTFTACLYAGDFDSDRLARIPVRVKEMIDQQEVAGAVTLIARNGKIALFDTAGWQDIEKQRPMRPDSIFQVMSMTKPVTGVGIMMLVVEGRIGIHDPVEKYLPEFKDQMVRDGATKSLRPPLRPISIRDLMTHTSGMPAPAGAMADLYTRMDRPLPAAVAEFAKEPLEFEPGSQWKYSNTGIATLGRIIEVVSGRSFESFVTERIFHPLGMKDSFFFAPPDKVDRIALVYQTRDGKLERADGSILGGDSAHYRKGAKYPAPEFGLYSTAQDLLAFHQMMLDEGRHNGNRLLSPASVKTMTMTHTGDLRAGFLPGGSGFGLTWEITKDASGAGLLISPGTFSHAGAFGTQAWVDKAKNLVGIFLIQKSGARSQEPKNLIIQMVSAAAEN